MRLRHGSSLRDQPGKSQPLKGAASGKAVPAEQQHCLFPGPTAHAVRLNRQVTASLRPVSSSLARATRNMLRCTGLHGQNDRIGCPAAGQGTSGNNVALPQMLERCMAWILDCKRAVNELRADVWGAVSHREKCCMLLSASMAACLALEQVSRIAALLWLSVQLLEGASTLV